MALNNTNAIVRDPRVGNVLIGDWSSEYLLRGGALAAAGLPRRRAQQVLVCQALSVCESLLIGLCGFLVLLAISHQMIIASFAAPMLFLTSLVAARINGASSYDLFESRVALLPGALSVGFLMVVAMAALNAGFEIELLGVIAMFASVYLAKLPSLALRRWLIGKGYLMRLIAVLGDDPVLRQQVFERLSQRSDIIVLISSKLSHSAFRRALAGERLIDEVVVTDYNLTAEDLRKLVALGVMVIHIDALDTGIYHGPWNAPASVLAKPPLLGWRGVGKRTFDVVGALVLLLVCAPIMLLAALAILLESGRPIFFLQERCGHYGRPFRMVKFRSMFAEKADHTGAQLTLRKDPRVTKVGNFLRRTSIDELPQLFNVLGGSMSLIGPRPHPSGAKAGGIHYDELIPDFYIRYAMPPGVSGLAQICGLRGNTETQDHLLQRFAKDLEYAENWSLWRDARIAVGTVRHLITGQNAF